ncbi:LacI family transcriptional regulator [Salinibacterium sp. dk2585]|uniref:LacI family DNA-binding transcriptional regulator n=1 Tax=unclassified Salinibacterium TaxID=2632331 RepID=UPI0011C24A04|nr:MULTISPECIES: LacI family DNA-binding transcriptional regulator [unclassified Salinibacterium]QEE61745.1 LacI family transcriptional regulator [Salinibacterium sp. dk2585]TXK54700.1 LacI family transcriptional regulator [Salinibacterium sp. dk5596]
MARVRLTDVARAAGVSMKTVSNVVHDYPHVSAETRQRVQQAIDQLGYRPNLSARRLATGRTGMIALAIPEIDHPYFSEVSRRIAEEAARRGYRVLIEQTLSDTDAEHAVLRDREEGLVDGVIFHPVSMGAVEIGRLHKDTPLVLLGEAAIPLTTDHVMIDNVAAARQSVEHLLAMGRRRIAFLGTVDGDVTVSTRHRLLGYQEALSSADIDADPRLVLRVAGFSPEDSAEAVRTALADGLEFDAILCRDDKFAVGAMAELHAAGRDIPNEVALIGWDDTALATYTHPSLTSVAPDKQLLARVALELLIERMEGHIGVGRHRIVPHSLALRASAPPLA